MFVDGASWDAAAIEQRLLLNHSPELRVPLESVTVLEDETLSIQMPNTTFADPDGEALTLSATLRNGDVLPTWLSFDPTTGLFSGTPSDAGAFSVKVSATDGGGLSVSDVFDLVVDEAVVTHIGTNGTDVLNGSAANDHLNGLDGDDLLRGDSRPEHIVIKAKASLVGDVGAIMELHQLRVGRFGRGALDDLVRLRL